MKLIREIGLISIETLDQDHGLHTKEFFNLWINNSSLSKANDSFPSTLSKIYIKGLFAKPFYELYPQKTHATQKEFPLLNRGEPKTHQRGRKEDSKEPEPLHSEKEGDLPSLLQRDKENTYLSNNAPSFEVGLKLKLSPKKPPKRRKPP